MKIQTELMPEVSISRFQRMKSVVDLNPPYQREGGVWKLETRSTLIDSIINGLDMPKLYFEVATTRRVSPEGLSFQYNVLDGKQRLEAILLFLAGELRLAEDFIYYEDETVSAGGMRFSELQDNYPLLARKFLSFDLPIVTVDSDSGDLIEEMFQRLNASTALNAAERRNALTGPTRDAANMLAEHQLLVSRSPIKSARYKYRELGAKFLAIEHQLSTKGRIVDTKADTLYDLFSATRQVPPVIEAADMEAYGRAAAGILDLMAEVFIENDPLLASIGTVVVYYIAFRDPDVTATVDRTTIGIFEELRRNASRLGEQDADYGRPANARLREYNAFVQSTNDGKALQHRAEVLKTFVKGFRNGDPLTSLDDFTIGELPEHEESEA